MTFAYDGAAAPTLHDVSLTVEAGTTVALVGGTGSGKSTLVRLIGRLYDPTSGSVLVDGADVRTLDLPRAAALDRGRRRRPVPVLGDRAREHRLRAPGREPRGGRARRRSARRPPGFIAELPDGYDTRVGERGLTLSGGQRQRLAIARALLADPRILVLDDATSSVDATTEQAIKEALREVMAGRTTFVIAHRLSTIALADEIVVLEDGRIEAHGSHAELLQALHAVRGDRREGPAGPGVPQPGSDRACRGSLSIPTGTSPSCAAGCARRAGAGASCAGCSSCCAPTARARC